MNLFNLLTSTATKPRLSGYMLPNINIFENECWYFSENLKIVALKLLELTQLTSPKISIYFNSIWHWGSIVMSTFLLTAHAQYINSESLYVLYFVKVLSVQF